MINKKTIEKISEIIILQNKEIEKMLDRVEKKAYERYDMHGRLDWYRRIKSQTFDKDKEYIVWREAPKDKCDEYSYAWEPFLQGCGNVKIMLVDNIDKVIPEDLSIFITRFNNLYKGKYKIVEDLNNG